MHQRSHSGAEQMGENHGHYRLRRSGLCRSTDNGKISQIKDTPASRAGMKYRAANGTSIANQGEKVIRGVTKEGQKIGMIFQIANVTKPLGSVRAMLDAGNRVVFDRDSKGNGGSFIMNKRTGAMTPIQENMRHLCLTCGRQ